MPIPSARLVLPALLLLAACGDRAAEERAVAGQEASRRACIANQLSLRSEEELKTLQGTNLAQIGGGAAAAALAFSRAYNEHALLRTAAYTQIDSALNHSPTPADSARHAASAGRFGISTPEAGSVEANAITDYERKFAAIYADPRHPCNWLDKDRPAKGGS